VRIDLHTHSRASDGTQSPAEVVRAAADAGLDVVALTDHDTAQGWSEAAAAAAECGIELVTGIEISTRFQHAGVHLLAYLPDGEDPSLLHALDRVLDGRNSRVPANLDKLEELKDRLLKKETVDADEVAEVFKGASLPKAAALY
jgi:predicted metal-dependent phosphoesterase TrpH